MKKISSLLLAVIMLLTCFGFAPKALADEPIDISAGEITLSGYSFKYTGEARTIASHLSRTGSNSVRSSF